MTVNTATGAASAVGALLNISLFDGGIDFDRSGALWGIEDGGDIFTIDTATGIATLSATTSPGFESLAIRTVPAPTTLALLGLGLVGLGYRRRGVATQRSQVAPLE